MKFVESKAEFLFTRLLLPHHKYLFIPVDEEILYIYVSNVRFDFPFNFVVNFYNENYSLVLV